MMMLFSVATGVDVVVAIMLQEPIFLRTPASTSQSDSSMPCAVIRRELYRPVVWKVMFHGRHTS